MRTLMQIHISQTEVSKEIWSTLRDIYPPGINPYSFGGIDLPAEDTGLQTAVNYLSKQGLVPATGFPPHLSNQFSMTLKRVYEASDLERCDYLTLIPKYIFGSKTERDENGILHIPLSSVKANQRIGIDWQHSIIVSDQVRVILQQNNLIGIFFTEVILDAKKSLKQSDVKLWEMHTKLKLPPLSYTMFVVNEAGKAFEGDYDKGCFVREGMTVPEVLYLPPELHYRAKDLKIVEPFDLALTYEQTGRGTRLFHGHIASKQFYDFCQTHQLAMEWQPVRIDP